MTKVTNQPTINVYNIKPPAKAGKTSESPDATFIADVYGLLGETVSETSERNDHIEERDTYIYGDGLNNALDIPVGHDFTPVNWLRRSVEIHKIQFMGRPFQVISTYDTKDESTGADPADVGRLQVENKKQKEFAEQRKGVIDDIIRDNGGHALFMDGAESASAAGSWVLKAWYDVDEKKYVLSPVEAVENCYAIWSKDDFRDFNAFAYVYQISKSDAIKYYGCDENTPTTALGKPLAPTGMSAPSESNQAMVTIMEITGRVPGWGSTNQRMKNVDLGNENEVNALIVGDKVYRVLDDAKKLPKYYIFPNKKQRRRPWGFSDISDAAININLTYVETLSDWRTVSSKVNFPKYKGFNFGPDTQMPKYEGRKVQILPLADGQDVVPLQQGDANRLDFSAQLDELKEQFVRETGISRVLFDDPSITLNSNQALLTSMKPTSDIAETKKQLWGPILQQVFTDALDTLAAYDKDIKQLNDSDTPWNLKIQWPSVMQKEDPVYQQMLLNRWNAKTMSLQSYLEAQGETKEEIDRIRDEANDPLTAAILGNQMGLVAQVMLQHLMPPGPPQGAAPTPGTNSATGQQAPVQAPGPANGAPGAGAVSQPGSGAPPVSPEGAIAQAQQQLGV